MFGILEFQQSSRLPSVKCTSFPRNEAFTTCIFVGPVLLNTYSVATINISYIETEEPPQILKQRHRARRSTVAILEATIVLLSFLAVSLSFGALKPRVGVPAIGTISYGTQKIELGLRTAFWDDYIKSPTTFMNLSNGRVT